MYGKMKEFLTQELENMDPTDLMLGAGGETCGKGDLAVVGLDCGDPSLVSS